MGKVAQSLICTKKLLTKVKIKVMQHRSRKMTQKKRLKTKKKKNQSTFFEWIFKNFRSNFQCLLSVVFKVAFSCKTETRTAIMFPQYFNTIRKNNKTFNLNKASTIALQSFQ